MRRVVLVLIVWATAIHFACGPVAATQPLQSRLAPSVREAGKVVIDESTAKIDLRILYAGLPDTDRQKDFVKFLSGHFEKVGVGDYLNFRAEQANGFDVVILDHDGADFRAPRPDVPRDYSRATITMGVPGALICSNLGLKTAYW